MALLFCFPPRASGEPLPRKILALYNPDRIDGDIHDITFHPLHRFAEMPLNYLGMELVYHDMRQPPPKLSELRDYRGVAAWFTNPDDVPRPEELCRWLDGALQAGLKVVLLGNPGLYGVKDDETAALPAACREMFRRLGVVIGDQVGPSPLFAEIGRADPQVVDFERRLRIQEFPQYRTVRALPGTTSYLTVYSPIYDRARSEAVVVSPKGGVALDPFVLYSNSILAGILDRDDRRELFDNLRLTNRQVRWRINPFRFFEETFALKGRPRPDVSTVNGRRLYFSHVDGDGFFNVSEFDRKTWSGEVFEREILKRYPDFPFTVSLITGYYATPRFGRREALDVSRRILALPNVEPASHGYAHPLNWRKGKVALDIPGYTFDAQQETLGSLAFINEKLLSKGKRAKLFLWTGDCVPSLETVRRLEEAGFLNMNGGDTRFDSRFNSRAYVSPLSRSQSGVRQIYTAAANENLYTNEWRGPYYGFREVLQTFEKTGHPRRLKPVNVYVHFYSAEKLAALKVLQEVYDWVHDQPLFPVYASRYVRMARAFFEVAIERVGPAAYRLTGGRDLRTLRFDGEARAVDLERSAGVLGFRRDGGTLYVHLIAADERRVVLSEKDPARPYLEEANAFITGWKTEAGGVRFSKRGWWKSELVLAGLAPKKRFRLREGGRERTVRSGADGRLSLRLESREGAGAPTEVALEPL